MTPAADKTPPAVRHIAIIMDGNGRWAERRGLSRSDGHRAGAERIAKVVDAARARGIEALTLYAFSTENWKRPLTEVSALMSLVVEFSRSQLEPMMRNNVRLRTVGRTSDLPFPARNALLDTIDKTRNNTGFTVNIALSYGGRAEIVDAVNKLLTGRGKTGPVTEREFREYLYAPDLPDPELLIRTGGELRISNFLLWQISYSEIYVTDAFWPDFDEAELDKALAVFNARDRRFGGVKKK